MKLSTRLAVIVGIAILGLNVVALFALQTLHSTMLADRHEEIRAVLGLARQQVSMYQTQEKQGKLSHAEAQARAIAALEGLRDGKLYLWARTKDAVGLVHPNPQVIGKVDWGAPLPSGRRNVEEYLYQLQSTDFAFFNDMSKRSASSALAPKINGVTQVEGWGWLIGFGVFVDDIDQAWWRLVWHFMVIGGVSLLAVTGLAVQMSRRIYLQLGGEPEYARQAALKIAAGDLSHQLGVRGSSQSLLGAIATMQESLRAMITGIQQGEAALSLAAGSLTSEMSHIHLSSRQSSDATASTAAAIEQMSVSIDQISLSARETEHNSARTTELADQGDALVTQVSSQIHDLLGDVTHAAELIVGLAERSREIEGMSAQIKDIADQTNLLALNAAIEAARAGEQGRGFTVVADEVRKLAERTTQATAQINQMVQRIRSDTADAVKSMQAVTPLVTGSVEMSRKAATALREINHGANASLERVRDVANAAAEQSLASNTVANNVEKIAQMVESAVHSVQVANQNVAELERLSAALHQSVARFRL
ncbi:methyl-accepting chemotaxis protein [Silvimonas sp. JCM 19000]